MAKISSAILDDGMVNVAKLIPDVATCHAYAGMGIGSGDTGAEAADTNLEGGETHYNDVTGTYEADKKSVWKSVFLYADLASHIIKELVICEDSGGAINTSLLRMTIDAITLNEGEQVTFVVKNAVSQGS